MVRRLAVLIVLALAAPSAAQAADVSVTSGVLRYTAAPGKVSNATFTENAPGSVTIARETGTDTDPLVVVGTGCSGTATSVTCPAVTSAVIDAGDMSDRITAGVVDDMQNFTGLTTIPTTITGGDGSRQPSANELAGARYQGRQIAETAKKLHG